MNRLIILLLALLVLVFTAEVFPVEKSLTAPDSVSISYDVDGEGVPALVFVHGWSCDKTYWQAQTAHFSKAYKVIAVDLAGHGDSGVNRLDWSIPLFGRDVAEIVWAEKASSVILIGHSMGGGVVLEAARLLGERVVGIVGVDTYQNVAMALSPEQIEGFLAPFKANFSGTTAQFVQTMFTETADAALVQKIVGDMSSGPAEVGIAAMRAALSFHPTEALQDVRVPIVAINSNRFPTNEEAGRAHAASFRVSYMKGLGHFVMLEDSESFNRLLEDAIHSFE